MNERAGSMVTRSSLSGSITRHPPLSPPTLGFIHLQLPRVEGSGAMGHLHAPTTVLRWHKQTCYYLKPHPSPLSPACPCHRPHPSAYRAARARKA